MKLKSIKLLIPSNYRLSCLGQLASDDFTLTVKFQSSLSVKLKTVVYVSKQKTDSSN